MGLCVHKISNTWLSWLDYHKLSMSGGNTGLINLHLDDFSLYCQEESQYFHTHAFPNNTKRHSKTSPRPPFKNPSLVLVGKFPPSLVSKRHVFVPCTGNTSESSDVIGGSVYSEYENMHVHGPEMRIENHWNHILTISHQLDEGTSIY